MILVPRTIPASTQEFADALRALIAGVVVARANVIAVTGAFAALESVVIDLTGATPLPRPTVRPTEGAFTVVSEFTADRLEVVGRPFGEGHRRAELRVEARAFRGQFVEVGGSSALRLAGASDGRLRASVAKADAQAALLAQASEAAAAQGVDVKDVQLHWRSDGPRELFVEAVVKAKKGFFPATVRVGGRLSIDASLAARAHGLTVDGEGMIGGVAAGLIRPKLQAYEGRSFSLLALPLDALRVTDVRLLATEAALTIEADFAG